MRRIAIIILFSLVLAIAYLAAPQQQSQAIPAFARKYRTSCTTCHVAPPKLNAFGRAFRNLGYRMPKGDEELVKQEKTSLGAPAWKRVWPRGIWPSDIPGGTFFGIALNSNFTVNPSANVTTEFDGIEEIGLLLGGTVGETFSFFGDVDLFEEGKPGGIGRLFVNYTPRRYFNVRVGQFEPRAVPFSNHRRLTRQTSYLADIFPTIPAGNFFGFSPNQRGIEIWGGVEGPGQRGGVLYAFGVVNGGFGGAAEMLQESSVGSLITEIEEHAEEAGGEFDVNSGKDVYVQASYKIGGLGVFGGGAKETLQQMNNWRDDSLTLGGYFYRGTTGAFLEQDGGEVFRNDGNRFIRTGVTFDWWFKDLNLFGGYQFNRDTLKDGRQFDAGITTVEAHYVTPWPWIIPAVRFENVNPTFGPSFHRTSLSTTLMLRANVLFTLDGVINSNRVPDLPPFDDRFRVGFRVYF